VCVVWHLQKGHFALAQLERMGHLGVTLKDQPDFYEPDDAEEFHFSSGLQDLAVVTQNVDPLHQRAGSKNVIQLHGGGTLVRCMNCGKKRDRKDFHREMEALNGDWVQEARDGYQDDSSDMRPDGDAMVKAMDYNHVHVPNCPHCKIGFYKPDVVFFGDSVPKHRLAMCREAVEAADGILVVGSSLAVHSAFRHIRAASLKGTPVAILNVGETRAEAEGLVGILKIEAPAGDTLSALAEQFSRQDLTLATAAAEL
jgi:NAD-dependent deacetylase sirtuin 4